MTLTFQEESLCILAVGWSARDKEHLGEELSDVLIYLIRLAERCHVDLPTAVLRKFELNTRKYPVADRVLGSSSKYTDDRLTALSYTLLTHSVLIS